jgi:hypothetical protein
MGYEMKGKNNINLNSASLMAATQHHFDTVLCPVPRLRASSRARSHSTGPTLRRSRFPGTLPFLDQPVVNSRQCKGVDLAVL